MRFISNWFPSFLGAFVWFIFHYTIIINTNTPTNDIIQDAITLSILLLILLTGLNAMLRLYKPGIARVLYLIIGNLLLAYGLLFIYEIIVNKALGKTPLLYSANELPSYLIVALLFTILQTTSFFSWIKVSVEERNEEKERRLKEEHLIRQAELNGLRQQLQPHFLFNSLNSIQSLLQFDSDKASKMVQTLADFLRGTVSGGESTVRTFREELKHLNLYLEIEMIRFEDRLSVNYSIDENTYEKEIPALILQPLVENAIKHGLYDTIGKITITIDAKLTDNFIVIKISNPYETEQGSTKAGTGFGLSSVSRRIQLIYLRNDLLKINSVGQLFTVTLKIPS